MLLLPDSVIRASRRLWDSLDAGKTTPEEGFRQILALIPDDLAALLELAVLRREAGDYAAAAEYGWRAVRLYPCMAPPYIELARALEHLPEKKALAQAVCELAIGMAGFDESVFDKLEFGGAGRDTPEARAFRELSPEAKRRLVSMSLRTESGPEPAEVTAELRHLRLLRDMWVMQDLPAETVDTILAAGPAMIPLLIGVLRGWARQMLGPDGDCATENALGLLGEMGTLEEFPAVLELVGVEARDISGAANWALGRIVERQREAAARFLATAIPGFDLTGRVCVWELWMRFPDLDPEGRLVGLLTEGLKAWPVESRDMYGMGIVTAVVLRGGSPGMDVAREAMRRMEWQLSPTGRQRCYSMLDHLAADFGTFEAPDLELTNVYEICGGEATWGGEEEDFVDEDEFEPVGPARRTATPERNDPCWCGSGKKYKKCHLEADERESRGLPAAPAASAAIPSGLDGLRRRIGDFLAETLPARQNRRMIMEFTGGEEPGTLDEGETMALVDWLVHDYVAPHLRRTVIEEFLARHEARLSAREREMVEAWSKSSIGLYEAQDVQAGVGATLKNLITGETFFVHDVNSSRQLARWDGMLARVLPGERGLEMTGAGQLVPRHSIEPLRRWLEADRADYRLPWPAYFKQNLPRIRREATAIHLRWREGLRLTNTDGEALVLSTAKYRVLDEAEVLKALWKCRELKAESDDGTFVWLNKEKTVLGNVQTSEGVLTLECNSRERLERGKEILNRAVGRLLEHEGDDFTSGDELKRRAGAGPEPKAARREKDEIPKDVRDRIVGEYLEKHYEAWPDTKLPALGGKTPRQAVKTAAGRAEVVSLLKSFENGEERKRRAGEVSYDVARLWARLGLER